MEDLDIESKLRDVLERFGSTYVLNIVASYVAGVLGTFGCSTEEKQRVITEYTAEFKAMLEAKINVTERSEE